MQLKTENSTEKSISEDLFLWKDQKRKLQASRKTDKGKEREDRNYQSGMK